MRPEIRPTPIERDRGADRRGEHSRPACALCVAAVAVVAPVGPVRSVGSWTKLVGLGMVRP
jgi:hypothetical protein